MSKTLRIFITGGHVTPALALIEEIQRQKKPWEIIFVGRKYAQEGSSAHASEYTMLSKTNIEFLPISAGRLSRSFSLFTFVQLLRIPWGFAQSYIHVQKKKPDAIVSFGGYIGLPVVVSGWLQKVPSLTHEQTLVPGLANRLLSRFVRRICVSFPDEAHRFPQEKVVVTGLPLRSQLFQSHSRPSFLSLHDRPVIYIAGGSTGSKSINELFYPIIQTLLRTFEVVHQVGPSWTHEAQQVKSKLPESEQTFYHPVPYVSVEDVSWLYTNCVAYVGRTGANTIAELLVYDVPSVLIPLPWSGGNEQLANAQYLEKHGSAEILSQDSLTSQKLYEDLVSMLKNHTVVPRQIPPLDQHADPVKRLVSEIEKLLAE